MTDEERDASISISGLYNAPEGDRKAPSPASTGIGTAIGASRVERLDPATLLDGTVQDAAVQDAAVQDTNMQDADVSESVDHDVETDESRSGSLRGVVEWLAVILVALSAALLIKAYVVQAFDIPSGSMETTVNIGDRILVNKLSYRFGDISRGDLVVFDRPEGTPGDTDQLIKRAIALPGETIEVRPGGRLWIWGPGETQADAERLEEPYLDPWNETISASTNADRPDVTIGHENCLDQVDANRCTLGPDSYFMLGDNRSSSSDSRLFGPVFEDQVVGRAFARIWPAGEVGGL